MDRPREAVLKISVFQQGEPIMKRVRLAGVVSTVALIIGAAAIPASAQMLELAVDSSPAGLDPHIVTAFSSMQIVNGTIYEGLTQIDSDLLVQPALAENWEISSDGLVYTFDLVDGATFHNGEPVEAEDVLASLRRVQSDVITSPLASRLASVSDTSAIDADTVEVTLSEPSAPFLTALASIAIVPRGYESDPDSLQQTPVGTGPFQFDEWQPNGFIRLVRNESYWDDGLPLLDGVTYNIVPEAGTRQVGLTSGQYHMLPNIDASTALQLEGQPSVTLYDALELAYTLVGLNTSQPPFDNPAVREALNYAIDREQIVAAALFGAGQPGGPLSPALTSWALPVSEYGCFETSAERSLQLLEEAGVETPVSFTLLTLPRQTTTDIAQIVQAQLAEAGFEVELNIPEIGQFVQDWRNSAFDAFVSINSGSPEPDDYFYRTFRSDGSTNVFKYESAELDALLDAGRAELDQESRAEIYADVQRHLTCTGPVSFLTYGQLYTATSGGVEGFEIKADRSLSYLRQTSLAE